MIRRATPDDAELLAQFRFAFRSEHRPPTERASDFITRCAAWMRERLAADSHWRAWILIVDDTPVGNVWLQLVEKIPNPSAGEPELHAYISNFFVVPEYRNRGGGAQLMEAALAECRVQNVDNIFLWPTEESLSLYERFGFGVSESVLVRASEVGGKDAKAPAS
jgi:GNAT superfamily N-acetyltransferase